MTEIGISTLIIIITNVFCSFQGLVDRPSYKRNNFQIDKILLLKDYKRLLTPGFFHVNGIHLIVNMLTLCFFCGGIESQLGEGKYLLIYFTGLVGGNLFSLFLYRHHNEYSTAAGASGAVSGIIFATIVLFPGFEIGFPGKHFSVPGWFYGFMYVLFSMYGISSKRDNIGHEAVLAGGVAGLIIALLLQPLSIVNNFFAILAVLLPAVFLIFIMVTRPRLMLIDNKFFNRQKKKYKIEQILFSEHVDHEQEIDLILEKIHQNGIGSLSKIEKDKLDYYSKIIQ